MGPAAPSLHPASWSNEALASQCDVTRTRRSGPGGQNRNKVETAIVVRHKPTGLVAEANERRSQHENLQAALFRLRVRLAIAVRCAVADDAPPSPTWRRHSHAGKLAINPANPDFPTLIAEALDHLEARDHDLRAAAERLGCSATQLTRLLKDEPRALALVNDHRAARGLRPLL